MANRTATQRCTSASLTSDGGKSYWKPVYQSKGRLKPQYAMVNGEPEHHKEGVYYLRFGTDGGKRQFVLVGKDPLLCVGQACRKAAVAPGPRTAGRSSNARQF